MPVVVVVPAGPLPDARLAEWRPSRGAVGERPKALSSTYTILLLFLAL